MSERVLPASHPVLRRRALIDQARAGDGVLFPISAAEIAVVGDRIDSIAIAVRNLPDQPLTPSQADRLRIIARELGRRANG